MSKSHSITIERLHELFDYREDGVLIRKQTIGGSLNGDVAGWKMPNGYFNVQVDKKNYGIHRLIFMLHYGFLPKEIDHIDGNPSNNKIENLRAALRIENGKNKKLSKNNTSGVSGVVWNLKNKKWYARIICNKKFIHLGCFDDFIDAVIARKKAQQKYFGEWARK